MTEWEAWGMSKEEWEAGKPSPPKLFGDSEQFLTLAKQLREMGAVEVSAFGIAAKFSAAPKSAPVAMDMSKLAAQLLKRPSEAMHVRDPLDADAMKEPLPEPGSIEAKRAYHRSILEQLNGA